MTSGSAGMMLKSTEILTDTFQWTYKWLLPTASPSPM